MNKQEVKQEIERIIVMCNKARAKDGYLQGEPFTLLDVEQLLETLNERIG